MKNEALFSYNVNFDLLNNYYDCGQVRYEIVWKTLWYFHETFLNLGNETLSKNSFQLVKFVGKNQSAFLPTIIDVMFTHVQKFMKTGTFFDSLSIFASTSGHPKNSSSKAHWLI